MSKNRMRMDQSLSAPTNSKRRELLAAALSFGAAAGATGVASAAPEDVKGDAKWHAKDRTAATRDLYRIDVHSHLIPDFYREALTAHGMTSAGGIPIPDWSPQRAVSFMNAYGIGTQIVSVSEPGVYFLPNADERLLLAQRLNNYMRSDLLAVSDPQLAGRFGAFAALPLGDIGDPQDVRNAADEAVRAIDDLGLDGVGIYSSYRGIYPGDRRLDPLLEILDARQTMVFLHPVTPATYPDVGFPAFLYEFPFDTTRAVVSMLYGGVFRRFPKIRWLIAHAGGTIPYLAYRTSLFTLYPVLAQNLGIDFLAESNFRYRELFYDTALSQAQSAMVATRAVTSVEHILFGSDWPFSGPEFLIPGDPAPQLDESFTASERWRVDRGNALAQFPGLAGRIGA